jgi:leucyl-tRNA synthetase
MSKSTGNFMTIDQCIEQYGADATRITIADCGDSLDDGNFVSEIADNTILKLFTLEEWIRKHTPADGFDFQAASDSSNLDSWDRLILYKMNEINQTVFQAYADMKFKEVVKHGFNALLSLKETYLIGKSGEPNPYILMKYMILQLVVLNPIAPHFCQYMW